ncbi:hypothetical protein TWF506_004678 [Arthrobotrys conoides]|uniref:F-box domain-containing protein n=1 Tax=Arthrobotrys conoides TaxID=74498 RepID=A0AAN8MWE1_9PEZI
MAPAKTLKPSFRRGRNLELRASKTGRLKPYYAAPTGSRFSALVDESSITQTPTIQDPPKNLETNRTLSEENSVTPTVNIEEPNKALEPHRALYINEVLEHILSFVSDQHIMTTKEETYSCKDSDGFWDLMVSCRLVNKRWRELIDNSHILQKRMWLLKEYKLPIETGELPTPDSSSRVYVKELKLEEERPRITLCYPFLSWLFRTVRDMRKAQIAKTASKGLKDSKTNTDDIDIDWSQLKERFTLAKFPNVFFTDPPISEARIHFDTNHPITWPEITAGSTTLSLGDMDVENTIGASLRGVRCISSSRADSVLRNGVLITNKKGVTLEDIIYAFDEYVKMAADPDRWWNKEKPKPWQIRWLSVGTVTMYPEREDSSVIGACEVRGDFDLREMDENERDEFKIFDLTIVEKSDKKKDEADLDEKDAE